MARRVFLHVGTPKSGTSYLQALWWQNRDLLADQGLLLPGTRLRDHFHAASVVCGRTEIVERLDEHERRVWDRIVDETAAWQGDALISHELFAPAAPERARAALGALASASEEVHVLVTTRDLARQLRSDWQQNVKQGRSETLVEFWELVRDDPRDEWWLYQDLPALVGRWTDGLPPDRVHLVVLPPEGAEDSTWLWQATCDLLGLDPAGLDTDTSRSNESLGVVQVEVVRRVQAAVPEADRSLDLRRLTRDYLAQQVLAPLGGESFTLPRELHAWARERGAGMARDLRGRGYDVVGDLDHLEPRPEGSAGRAPSEVTDSEVADVAVQALARVLVGESRRRRRDESARRSSAPVPAVPQARRAAGTWLSRVRRKVGGRR